MVGEGGNASLVPLPAGDSRRRPQTAPPNGPAGVLLGRDGSLWYTVPDAGELHRIEACGPSEAEPGCDPLDLAVPRGLAPARERGLVWLADSGQDRVLLLRPDATLVQALGQSPQREGVGSDAEPGVLSSPWDVEVDGRGAVYVLDHGNRRIQKFSPTGQVRAAFWRRMQATGLVTRPVAIASRDVEGSTELFVLDGDRNAILTFDETGNATDRQGISSDALRDPLVMCVAGRLLFVGDNGARAVLAFRLDGGAPNFVGPVPGYEGNVAALFAAAGGDVWVHPGDAAPARLEASGGFAASGLMWTERISVSESLVVWHRFNAALAFRGEQSAIQFFMATSREPADPPVDPAAAQPFAAAAWRPVAPNASAGFIGSHAAPYLWLGVQLGGDGASSPLVSQIKVEFNHLSYLPLLPRIYREPLFREQNPDDFLLRFLSLFETFANDATAEIELLDALFSAAAAPPAALPWLAALVGLQPGDDWTVARLRRTIADASAADERRGTAAGLRQALSAAVDGITPIVEDGAEAGAWIAPGETCGGPDRADGKWTGGEDARLGFTTYLAAVDPYGVVLDVSGTIDHTNLIDESAVFEPAFAGIAHRATIRLPPADLSETQADAIRAVIAREGPAHVAFDLQAVGPRPRLGLAVLGSETILGGPAMPNPIASPAPVLGGAPRGRLGQGLQIGRAATL
jgi:phage tail-like protein